MTPITNANLGWNEAGTPVSEQFDDVYFSNVNGLEETRYVFIQQNHLPERWQTYDQQRFIIAETGFGTGLNFLAVWQCFEKFRAEYPNSPLKELHFISFEKFPLSCNDLSKAHQAWPELANYAEQLQKFYPISLPECHRILFADGAVTLDLWFGDIKSCLPNVPVSESGLVDCWFLDGFAPSKNPEMWNQDLFNGMATLAKEACTCATFTAAGFVRRGLIQAGFDMKKVKGFGTKREMISGQLNQRERKSNIKPWYARPENDQIEDIAIIGGGIASATLAEKLCQRGKKVTLYCRDSEAALNASGNRQGALYPLLNGTHSGVSRVYAPAFIYARQYVEQLSEQVKFEYDWCGVTQLAWDDKSTKKLNSMLEGDFPKQLVFRQTAKQTTETIGLPVDLESVSYPLGGWLSPRQLTQNLIQYLVDHFDLKVKFQTNIDQLSYLKEIKRWQLSSGNQTYQHQSVVIANGHRFSQFDQTAAIPATPVKGQVSHIPTTDQLKQLKTVLCYNGYMTPQSSIDHHHCIGASHDRDHINQIFEPEVQSDNKAKILRSLPNQTWPNQIDVSDNLARQGIRSVTRDHLPFVGNVCDFDWVKEQYSNLKDEQDSAENIASYPNLFCFLALGARGLCSAPLMAELLASQICNNPLPLPVDVLETIHPGKMWVRRQLKGRPVTGNPS